MQSHPPDRHERMVCLYLEHSCYMRRSKGPFTYVNSKLLTIGAGLSCNILAYLITTFALTQSKAKGNRIRSHLSTDGRGQRRCVIMPRVVRLASPTPLSLPLCSQSGGARSGRSKQNLTADRHGDSRSKTRYRAENIG